MRNSPAKLGTTLAFVQASPYSESVMKSLVANTTGMDLQMMTSMMITIIETTICWPAEPDVR